MTRYRRWVQRLHGGQLVMVLMGWLTPGVLFLWLSFSLMGSSDHNREMAARLRLRGEYLVSARLAEEQAVSDAQVARWLFWAGVVPVMLVGFSMWWWFGARRRSLEETS